LSVLFTEHSMDVVFEHAHRILVMARGSLMAQGDPQSIAQHPDVKAVYFGRGTRGARRAVSADDVEGVSSASVATTSIGATITADKVSPT
jgi:ABC-type sulfate/molybdate transport systems ATPase subunit